MSQLPDDLQDLFNQLDEKPDIPPPPVEVQETPDEELDRLESLDEGMPDVLRPADVRVIAPEASTEIVDQQQAELTVAIDEYRDQLRTVTNEVLDATRSDRKEAQDVIDMLRALVQGQGNTPSKACVDGLVKAVEVKANINQNAINIMGVNAKFLAATKPSVNVKNNNLSITGDELSRVLESGGSDDLD